jgi:hypothetical protein
MATSRGLNHVGRMIRAVAGERGWMESTGGGVSHLREGNWRQMSAVLGHRRCGARGRGGSGRAGGARRLDRVDQPARWDGPVPPAADNASGGPLAVSADGRYMAFVSSADGFAPGADPRVANVFLRDGIRGETVLGGNGCGVLVLLVQRASQWLRDGELTSC